MTAMRWTAAKELAFVADWIQTRNNDSNAFRWCFWFARVNIGCENWATNSTYVINIEKVGLWKSNGSLKSSTLSKFISTHDWSRSEKKPKRERRATDGKVPSFSFFLYFACRSPSSINPNDAIFVEKVVIQSSNIEMIHSWWKAYDLVRIIPPQRHWPLRFR